MKIYLALILCIISFNMIAYSHDCESVYRAIYHMDEIRDSVNSKYSEDILRLELYPQHSFCYSQHTWYLDSLNMQPNGDKIWDELFMSAFKKEGVGTRAFPHRRNTFEVVKNHSLKEITTFDVIDDQYFTYSDSIAEFVWTISDSTATINGYSCNSATCFYHGRKWNAWFCTELPWPDGPWKFCGLPGLIIQIYDTDGLYKFELLSLMKIPYNQIIKPWAKEAKETDRKKFLEDKLMYFNKLDNNLNAEFGIMNNNLKTSGTRYRIGLECDYNKTTSK